MIYKYVDWDKYWHEVVEDQIINIEDYEPKLRNCTYDQIKSFMDNHDGMIKEDCEIAEDGQSVNISFGIGFDEDGCSMTFIINNSDVIVFVEYRG